MFELAEFSEKMNESLNFLNKFIKEMSVGDASPGLIENIKIEAYGSYMHLYELASISVSDNLTLAVSPFDKSIAIPIEKGIYGYNKNLSCSNRGGTIYVSVPRLTEEVRRDFIKSLKTESDDTKIKIRDIRRHAMDKLKLLTKDAHLSEDIKKMHEKEVEDLTHKFIEKIDKAFHEKEKQIMTI